MSALGFSFGPEEAATETPPYPCKLLYCNGRDCVGASPALSLLCCVQVVANANTSLREHLACGESSERDLFVGLKTKV